jgi:hypothetical protein
MTNYEKPAARSSFDWFYALMLASATTDWITAIGSTFAAIGTVGAVMFALWQVRRQDTRRMRVQCVKSFRLTDNDPVVSTVALYATNIGRRTIRIVGVLLRFDDRTTFPWPQDAGDDFPILVDEGVTVTAEWDEDRLRVATKSAKAAAILSGSFLDGLGNTYSAPFPGVKVKRKGWPWRLRTEYVVPK